MKTLMLALVFLSQSIAFGAGSGGLLEDLRQLKAREAKRFFQVRKQLVNAHLDNVDQLKLQFNEHKKRTSLLDRLIFYTDTHYKGGSEKSFLRKACLKMAEREVQGTQATNKSSWLFLRNLSEVIQEASDSDLTAAALLESYMSYATVNDPKPAKNFLKPRDYTNGEEYETARSVSPENVGDLVRVEKKTSSLSPGELGPPQLKSVFITETERSLETN